MKQGNTPLTIRRTSLGSYAHSILKNCATQSSLLSSSYTGTRLSSSKNADVGDDNTSTSPAWDKAATF